MQVWPEKFFTAPCFGLRISKPQEQKCRGVPPVWKGLTVPSLRIPFLVF